MLLSIAEGSWRWMDSCAAIIVIEVVTMVQLLSKDYVIKFDRVELREFIDYLNELLLIYDREEKPSLALSAMINVFIGMLEDE